MSQDLELIKQLDIEVEKRTGKKLNKFSLYDKEKYSNRFIVDPGGNVVEIGLFRIKMAALLPIILKFQHLKVLALGDAGLEYISSLNQLQGLKHLYLGENQISDISNLNELRGLKELDIYGNQIRDISSLNELQGLKELYLSSNQIRDISSLLELKHLKVLDLRHNKITHVPAKALDLGLEIKWEWRSQEETGLLLEGNPLESPPPEIVKKGTQAVREYLKALLMGDGTAGKTSLVKQLRGDPFDKNESQIHGINIAHWAAGPAEPVPTKQKGFTLFWKIAAGIGGLIAFLSALATLFDSQALKKAWDWLTGLFK